MVPARWAVLVLMCFLMFILKSNTTQTGSHVTLTRLAKTKVRVISSAGRECGAAPTPLEGYSGDSSSWAVILHYLADWSISNDPATPLRFMSGITHKEIKIQLTHRIAGKTNEVHRH